MTEDSARFVRVHDRHLSLWQSVVSETVRDEFRAGGRAASTRDELADPTMRAANEHVQLVMAGEAVPQVDPDEPDLHKLYVYLSDLGFRLGLALADGDTVRAAALQVEFRPFSDKDPKFATCATTYAYYLAIYEGVFKYNDWEVQGGKKIDYGVIDWKLPNDAKVGIIGDWGTGLDDARQLLAAVMHEGVAAIVHLGDIYYSATPAECRDRYAKVIDEVFLAAKRAVPVFTLAGNHDYYALGYGFYDIFARMNPAHGFPTARQVASYFCLRTEDGGWQFLGMDTGYNDSNPADQGDTAYSGPWLQPSEVTWLQDKLDRFDGLTVLLSHHQLYSANAKLNGSESTFGDLQYLNPYLFKTFLPYFGTKVAAWLWGHEHNFVLYEDGLLSGPAKGRLIGCSAYEELESSDPYAVNYPEVRYLDPVKYRVSAEGGYFNHAYAVIDLSKRASPTDAIQIRYVEFPSWGDKAPPSPAPTPIHCEKLARPEPGPTGPVSYDAPIQLLAEEGVYVGALVTESRRHYPTLSTDGPINLRFENIGGTNPTLQHGDTLTMETLEVVAGTDNVLGAWSTPTLYYYRRGAKQQLWQVFKRDPTDPQVHYGDEVGFVNVSYAKQWILPYWSRVYGSIYLTTKTDAAYWWVIRPPVNEAIAPAARRLKLPVPA